MQYKTPKTHELLWMEELKAFSAQSQILQKWEPVSYIDKGTFSRIFRVVNRETGQTAALKVIPNPLEVSDCHAAGTPQDEFYRTRFEASKREAEIMTRFHGDRNVVQYLETPEYLCRTFRGVHGEALLQYAVLICMPLYINHKKWGPLIAGDRTKKIRLGMDIARALVHFEEEGVYHRDIKPGNVLMDSTGVFCLSDVGEAKLESELTTIGFHGTRPYMAPEVYKQENERTKMRSDHRSDIYSLGMILYRLFNKQQFPFLTEGGTLTEEATASYRQYVKKHQISGDNFITDSERTRLLRYDGKKLPPPSQADEQLAKVILRACAYDKKDRYQKAQELLDALSRCLKASEQPQSMVHKPSKFHRRSCMNAVLGVSAAAAVVTIAVCAYLLGRSGHQPAVPEATSVVTETAAISATDTSMPVMNPIHTLALTPTSVPTATQEPMQAPTRIPTATPRPTETSIAAPVPGQLLKKSDIVYLLQADNTWAVASCSSSVGNLSIPAEVDNLRVTSLRPGAFENCSHLRSIELPDSITFIGANAFANCTRLQSVKIPHGVTSIGAHAFNGCTVLRSVALPETLRSIGDYAFSNCTSLKTLEIPSNVDSIGDSTFADCKKLILHVQPGSYGDIYAEKYEIRGFVEHTATPMVTPKPTPEPTAASTPFPYNTGDQLELDGLTFFMQKDRTWAVRECERAIKNVVVPEKLQGIPVTVISNGAFARTQVENVTLPEGLTVIDKYAFSDCNIRKIKIPEGVVSIGDNAFEGCNQLREVSLPYSLNHIGKTPFFCYSKEELYVSIAKDHPLLAVENGFLINKEEHTLVAWLNRSESEVIIPEGITVISDYTFRELSSLQKVSLPYGVTSIENWAFFGCSQLKEITFPESLTTIGEKAFKDCYNLKEIILPEGLLSIGKEAFNRCHDLANITLPESVVEIGDEAFSRRGIYQFASDDMHRDMRITFRVPKDSYAAKYLAWYHKYDKVQYYTIPTSGRLTNGLSYRRNGQEVIITAYNGSSNTLIIPHTIQNRPVTQIESGVFKNHDELVSVQFPSGLLSIGSQAFRGCDALEEIIIPDSVETIGQEAFYYCDHLRSVTLGENIHSIGSNAFAMCQQLNGFTCAQQTISKEALRYYLGYSDATPVKVPSSINPVFKLLDNAL